MLTKLLLISAMLGSAPSGAQKAQLVGNLPRKEAKPLQAMPGLETQYGVVRTSEGARLRTIVTRPLGARGPLPAIFVTQWVSCGSLDVAAGSEGLLPDLATQSGMVLIRVERAGTGDSEGPPCSQLDYDTEVRHYREAFDQLALHPWVDPARMLIFGISLGATTAPLVAEGKKVAGVAVQGGGAVTYLERMINFDRLYLERSGKFAPGQIHEEMQKRILFHVEYLLGAKTPEQVASDRPELAGVWQSIRGGAEAPPHYGRPYAWHWQAARKDFLEAWTKLNAPVLVVYGEYDQFEPRHGHELIAQTLNRLRPGSATFMEVPGADHDMELYGSAEAAYRYLHPISRRELLVKPLLEWARRVTSVGAGEIR